MFGASTSIHSSNESLNEITRIHSFMHIKTRLPHICTGGMYTANTMASAIEAMGMSLPFDSSIPAEDPLKKDECRLAAK